MPLLFQSELRDLAAKVEAGERLTREDGIRLQRSHEIIAIGMMADVVRRRTVGDVASYDAAVPLRYTQDLAALSQSAREAVSQGARSVRLVGGPTVSAGLSGCLAALTAIGEAVGSGIVIEAFTPGLIAGLGEPAQVLTAMASAGLHVLGHGEPVVGDPSYIAVHKAAHNAGIKSVAAFKYGQGEDPGLVVDALLAIRQLHADTGGVLAVLPLPYRGSVQAAKELSEASGRRVRPATTGDDDMRTLALARLLVDNVTHIAASVPLLGIKYAQTTLACGVDHLVEPGQPAEEMLYLYNQAARQTVARDGLYRPL